jgi:hypothetical protein
VFSFSTGATVPKPPAAPTKTGSSSTTISLAWLEPDSAGSLIQVLSSFAAGHLHGAAWRGGLCGCAFLFQEFQLQKDDGAGG